MAHRPSKSAKLANGISEIGEFTCDRAIVMHSRVNRQ
jgi:hypothetical protein